MESLEQRPKSDPRLFILGGFTLLMMSVLISGLWQVQVKSTTRYEESMRRQYYRTVRIPASRGLIFDRWGQPLAENRPSYNINIYLERLSHLYQDEYAKWRGYKKKSESAPEDIREALEEIQPPADVPVPPPDESPFQWKSFSRYVAVKRLTDKLGERLGVPIELDYDIFTRHWNQKRSLPFTALTDISQEMVAKFLSQLERPPGFELDVRTLRTYPHKETACHILGYLRLASNELKEGEEKTNYRLQDFAGIRGLEMTFEDELRGRPGRARVKVDQIGYRVDQEIDVEPIPGNNLFLTLDLGIQHVATQALLEADPDESVRGSVIVLNPKNGDILAMVSKPGFDPNDFVPRISHDKYNRDYIQPEVTVLQSRATYHLYQPGSIFKIIIGIAALSDHAVDPYQRIQTHGGTKIGNHTWRDLARPGSYNFTEAFAKSSNDYFIEIGSRVSRTKIAETAKAFGFGRVNNLPIDNKKSGTVPDDAFIKSWEIPGRQVWTAGNQANLCIGQGELSATPIQIAEMMCGVANEGIIYEHRLVRRVESSEFVDPEDQVTQDFPPKIARAIDIPKSVYKHIKAALLKDVADSRFGTGSRARIEGFNIGGKTGTADSLASRTTWFASMAPMEDPQYVVVVMIEDGEYGGSTCAPVARKVYEYILQQNQLLESSQLSLADQSSTN